MSSSPVAPVSGDLLGGSCFDFRRKRACRGADGAPGVFTDEISIDRGGCCCYGRSGGHDLQGVLGGVLGQAVMEALQDGKVSWSTYRGGYCSLYCPAVPLEDEPPGRGETSAGGRTLTTHRTTPSLLPSLAESLTPLWPAPRPMVAAASVILEFGVTVRGVNLRAPAPLNEAILAD